MRGVLRGHLAVVIASLVSVGLWLPSFAQEDKTPVPSGSVNIEIILDVSGSMAQVVGNNETRMDAAKRVLGDVIGGIPDREGINVGLRIYGHKGNNTEAGQAESCQSSDLVVKVDGVDKDKLNREIEALQPTGWTPLALSLERSAKDLKRPSKMVSNYVILVTDGLETCGGDPGAAASALRSGSRKATVSVIGFGLVPEEQETIALIAEQGGGKVYSASDADALSEALFTALSTPVPDIEKPTPAPRATESAEGPTGSRENPIPLGTAADVGGKWYVSVIDVVPDATEAVMLENQFNAPPPEGSQFYIVRISATYEGNGSSVLPAELVFKVVGESSVAYETFRATCGVYPDHFAFTDVFTGGTLEGNLCWAVKTSDVDSLVLYSEDLVTFDQDHEVWFALSE